MGGERAASERAASGVWAAGLMICYTGFGPNRDSGHGVCVEKYFGRLRHFRLSLKTKSLFSRPEKEF